MVHGLPVTLGCRVATHACLQALKAASCSLLAAHHRCLCDCLLLSVHHRWCAGDVAVTQHISDLIQVGSATSAAVKEANKVQGVSRWLVLGKPLSSTTPGSLKPASSRAAQQAGELDTSSLLNAKGAALERCLLLFKLLGNLHYWSPELPKHLEQKFVKRLVGALQASCDDEAEFKAACGRVAENLKGLVRFLQPVSPDEETDDEGDILLTQLEVDLVLDIRKCVLKLAETAWRDKLPPPPVSRLGCSHPHG